MAFKVNQIRRVRLPTYPLLGWNAHTLSKVNVHGCVLILNDQYIASKRLNRNYSYALPEVFFFVIYWIDCQPNPANTHPFSFHMVAPVSYAAKKIGNGYRFRFSFIWNQGNSFLLFLLLSCGAPNVLFAFWKLD